MSSYTHDLVWITRARDGALAGLNIIRNYPCFDDNGTRAHIAALVAAADVPNVHFVERT